MTEVAESIAVATPPLSETLAVTLTPEDSARLAAEAQRRQIDAIALAEMLLHESLAALLPLSPLEIESLEKLYDLPEKTEVLEFLQKHPFLVPLVLEAPAFIYKQFPDCKPYVQVYVDYEDASWVTLRIGIDTDIKDPEEAIDRLERIEDEFDPDRKSQGKIFFNLH